MRQVVDHSVVSSVDWLPTALAIAGGGCRGWGMGYFSVCTSVCACICTYICKLVYMRLHMCRRVYMCMYVRVHICAKLIHNGVYAGVRVPESMLLRGHDLSALLLNETTKDVAGEINRNRNRNRHSQSQSTLAIAIDTRTLTQPERSSSLYLCAPLQSQCLQCGTHPGRGLSPCCGSGASGWLVHA